MKLQLKENRERIGYTIKELAEELNLNANTYGQYERGIRNIPLEVLEDIANYYDISIDKLIGREHHK